jgi:hypothetical protein
VNRCSEAPMATVIVALRGDCPPVFQLRPSNSPSVICKTRGEGRLLLYKPAFTN